MKFHVFVDFDGTITLDDTTDLLLTRFADPYWRVIEEDWKAGRIGSRECMVRQIDLLRASEEELEEFIEEIDIDPGFSDFVRLCAEHGNEITIVSDGLDRTIATVLRRVGLAIPYRANHLEYLGDSRWRLRFPHAKGDCRALAGHCKCASLEAYPRVARIVVGDGRSDFCMAKQADLVLAKGALEAHCRQNGIPHQPFRDFTAATGILAEWLDQATAEAAARGA
ncbi:MAG: MtnX-like HAD-IB family phosphatase [Hyphomicrobiaceae bacterium]|jgi:Haloacid Dehalogenase superfamily, subfamily IB, phosphoserine phosphatase-like/2,3-diketo-5-methylthio-1-phosphopentane phosphatase